MSSVAENTNVLATALYLDSGAWSSNPCSLEWLLNPFKLQCSCLKMDISVTSFSGLL